MGQGSRIKSLCRDLSIRRAGNNRGATLVEVLATVTLLGLVGVGLYALTITPVRALETMQERTVQERTLRSVVQKLTHDLANVTPNDYMTRPHFFGGSDGMEFTVGPQDNEKTLRRVEYTFRPWWLAAPSDPHHRGRLVRQESGGDAIEMISARQMRFEYYDQGDNLWLTSWDSSVRGWPAAVRLTLTVSDGDAGDLDEVELLFPLYTGRTFRGMSL